MQFDQYLELLVKRLRGYFNVERDYDLLGYQLSIYAVSTIRSDKIFATRKISLGGYENLEHCLVKGYQGRSGEKELAGFISLLKKATLDLVHPHSEHMSTTITGVLVSGEGFCPEAIGAVEKFRYGRTYRWGLFGWSQVRLVIVDLVTGELHANKQGREVVKSYRLPDDLPRQAQVNG